MSEGGGGRVAEGGSDRARVSSELVGVLVLVSMVPVPYQYDSILVLVLVTGTNCRGNGVRRESRVLAAKTRRMGTFSMEPSCPQVVIRSVTEAACTGSNMEVVKRR